jgi:hypothetical protein
MGTKGSEEKWAEEKWDMFLMCLDKIDISDYMKNDIINYFENKKEYFNSYTTYVGMFLRFYDKDWEFFETKRENNIEELCVDLEETNYSVSIENYFKSNKKPNAKSIYIGEIKLTKEEIDFYRDTKKYNL